MPAHPGDPQATALLLNAVIFQELYRLDLLDTTFYANDGFLTGRHATEEDPKTRDRILGLADEAIREADWRIEPQPQRHRRALCPRLGAQPQMHLHGHGRARLWRRLPPGHQGQGRRGARAADWTRITWTPSWWRASIEYVVGALPWPFKLLIGFAGITGSKTRGPGDAQRRRQSRRDHQRRGAHRDCPLSAPRSPLQRGDPGGARPEEAVPARLSLLPGRGQPAQG